MIIELGVAGAVYAAYRALAGRRRQAKDARQAQLTRDYVAWAERTGFVEHGNDARYRGTLEDVDVILDNGVRASGNYLGEIRLALALAEPRGTVHRGESVATPLREALVAAMKAEREISATRIEDDVVVLTTHGNLAPERLEALARRMIAVCRPRTGAIGPYR